MGNSEVAPKVHFGTKGTSSKKTTKVEIPPPTVPVETMKASGRKGSRWAGANIVTFEEDPHYGQREIKNFDFEAGMEPKS